MRSLGLGKRANNANRASWMGGSRSLARVVKRRVSIDLRFNPAPVSPRPASPASKWRALALLVLTGAGAVGLWWSGEGGPLLARLEASSETLAVASGFGVKQIDIEGQQHTTDAEISSALGASPSTLMLTFDTAAAKERLEHVSWIKHAQVMRLLPSTLRVVVEERTPFAIWQHQGKTYVVDADGTVLAAALREAYADLPLVVGDGAEKNAGALLDTLAPYQNLKKQMIAALRVGDRRWTLRLASGLDVMLPDDNVAEALETLVQLDHDKGVLARNFALIDLRLADRVTVRPRDTADTGVAGAEAIMQETPTASTRSAKPKGDT